MGIASGLGKPVKVDATTLNVDRARFARVCVEVDLRKPLKGSVLINKERCYVAYEGMSNICSNCGIYGHQIHQCPLLESVQRRHTAPEKVMEETQKGAPEEDGFKSVRRPNRRVKDQNSPVAFGAGGSRVNHGRNLQDISKITENKKIEISNSFGNLGTETIEVEKGEVPLFLEENKENQLNGNIKDNGKGISRKINETMGGEGKQFKIGGKGDLKGRWVEALKSRGPNGLRGRVQQNRPTRGLVFGPVNGEVERSSSGKRMRVEGDSAGRRGASFGGMREGEAGSQRLLVEQNEPAVQTEMVCSDGKQKKERGEQDANTTSSHAMELGSA